MAKPFARPDPGPGEGSSSSGAGPPATQPPPSGTTAPSPPAPIGPVASGTSAHGTLGYVPSASIPIADGNPHHHQQAPLPMPQQPGQVQHPYQPYGGSWAPPGPVVGSPVESHPVMLPMTPPASGFATTVQTPQLAQVNEQFVQAFCEALYRCSLGDGPPTPLSQSPPSASCSPFTNGGFYGSGQVFFPRTPACTTGGCNGGRTFFHQTHPTPGGPPYAPTPHSQPTPVSANSNSSSSGISSLHDTPSCSSGTPHCFQGQLQPIQFNWHDDGDSSESEASSSQATSSSGCSPHCLGLDGASGGSFGSQSTSSTLASSSSSGGTTLYAAVPPHLDYMAGREKLQEFPGKIPQRKRKPRTPKPKKPGLLEQPLMWQVAVTAALIVLGCGYLAAR
ncbi:nascent polypeptide-associated complex subunit alpha, muscle-specific form-like [Anopheles nili]|uniref:nascent polypeptide-associated complex subunit alpha, muscle-specific form-like n=1 Tax=Anopheles nili TaxID=185578 RepID=UPI00237B29FD|nr:nascent polypeptide-associated complex subunit alpha, muscle-specific form-like [Anopheles nili]